MFLHLFVCSLRGGVSQHAMGQARGGVYPSIAMGQAGMCVSQHAIGHGRCEVVGTHPIGTYPFIGDYNWL